MALLDALKALRPMLASAAQAVYDEWDQEDGEPGGGICDLIADAMSDAIASALPAVEIIPGGHDGDDHAWLILHDGERAAGVDIVADVYEVGGGYSWTKVPGVIFRPQDVDVWPLVLADVIGDAAA